MGLTSLCAFCETGEVPLLPLTSKFKPELQMWGRLRHRLAYGNRKREKRALLGNRHDHMGVGEEEDSGKETDHQLLVMILP